MENKPALKMSSSVQVIFVNGTISAGSLTKLVNELEFFCNLKHAVLKISKFVESDLEKSEVYLDWAASISVNLAENAAITTSDLQTLSEELEILL
jgi:hypothetical protein